MATHIGNSSVTIDDVVGAAARIAGGVVRTPCVRSPALSDMLGLDVWCKCDFQQTTGSFKERGARNLLMQLDPAQRARGIVGASAGNHALALAYHGRDLGMPVTVVMPRFAPLIKQARAAALGARVLLHGDNIGEARERAEELVASDGLMFITGFNAPEIIAGAGTVGLEILEDVPDCDAVIAPIGGGGLVAGIGVVLAARRPQARLVGVEPERAASFAAARKAGRAVRIGVDPTLADGLAVPEVGDLAFQVANDRISSLVTVDERAITLAILRLVEMEKAVVEGAGAAALAALMAHRDAIGDARRVVLVLCGGNIDPAVLSRVIEHGLALDGRLVQFLAVIRDRPGGLADIAAAIASTGASVKQISHERAFGDADVSKVQVLCQVEVRGTDHADHLFGVLRERGITVLARGTLREIAAG
jgi:threonine dehydratase